jgi:hypothetical protein
MKEDKKQELLGLIRQRLETVTMREYHEIAEIPTDRLNTFMVKYSFLYDGKEGVFNIVGHAEPTERVNEIDYITLKSEFDTRSVHYNSLSAKDQVDQDLAEVTRFLNQ